MHTQHDAARAAIQQPAEREMTWDEAEREWAGLRLADEVSADEADELADAFQSGKRAGIAEGFRKGFAAGLASQSDPAR